MDGFPSGECAYLMCCTVPPTCTDLGSGLFAATVVVVSGSSEEHDSLPKGTLSPILQELVTVLHLIWPFCSFAFHTAKLSPAIVRKKTINLTSPLTLGFFHALFVTYSIDTLDVNTNIF